MSPRRWVGRAPPSREPCLLRGIEAGRGPSRGSIETARRDAGQRAPGRAAPGRPAERPAATPGSAPTAAITAGVQRAWEAWQRGQEALRKGDWATYGQEQKRIEEALRSLREAR